jgi:hypothetical protein
LFGDYGGDSGEFRGPGFANPPYFLSNGGITCPAGKMVSVHKGDWDKSRGADGNHEYNRAWLAAAQRVLKPTTSTFETKSANSFRCSATSIFSNF